METIIKTENIKKCFPVFGADDFYALKGLSMEIPKGELTILKGRSGSGKTTLLNMLSALDTPSEGKIYFDGNEITKYNANGREKLRRYEIGYIFQTVALLPVMNAYENVEFGLRLAKFKGNYDQRIKECLEQVGMEKRMKHMPYEMSGGEQQRVAIARAIAHKPKVIFADEPTASLDSTMSLQVVKVFKELIQKEKVTIVMTTHDTDLMDVGSKLYELEDGEIIGSK
ncbi:ABC transporter ATP-binding protein [Anaeromicropila populeti]|uniref:Putative ABC transport system ATP-binding protein n=1 Tax=Anaeromicropila populeti TaxID=37658 RepID=A0A1I6IX96_9FIRM|nr:ABC transporter ATP-binding protein [Anaeromicropila populeti]SFR71366.1 putative ABC transport system ATP-binding protein [Anaeromicropila populeti]